MENRFTEEMVNELAAKLYIGLNEEEEDAWVSIGEDALYELLEKQKQ